MPNDPQSTAPATIPKSSRKDLKPKRYIFEYRTVLTPAKKVRFLKKLAETPNVTWAADQVKVSRRALYDHRDSDLDFAKAWDDALQAGIDRLEHKAHLRAFEGNDKPLTYKGEITRNKDGTPVTIKEYSDTLTIFLLKAHRPEKYRESTNVNVSGTLTLEALISASMTPPEPEPGPVIDHTPEE